MPYGRHKAQWDAASCARCGQKITAKIDYVEPWEDGPKLGGKTRWVHYGCSPEQSRMLAPSSTIPGQLTTADRDTIREEVASVFESRVTEAEQRTKDIARRSVEQFFHQMRPERIEVKRIDGTWREISDTVHPAFKKVYALAQSRKHVLLVGPAGSGKSYLTEQIANALETEDGECFRFGMISCSGGMSEGQLIGRLLPTGESGRFEYIETDFVRCFRDGGVFLCDEMDACDPNVLIVINAALANKKLVLTNHPDCPMLKQHEDFVFIGAANTFGRGADRMYCGRNALDEATLDRFRIGQVEMDYSEEVDKALCPDDALRTRLQRYRRRVNENRLERIVSTRFLKDAYEMKVAANWSDADIDGQLFMGWREDEIALVKN